MNPSHLMGIIEAGLSAVETRAAMHKALQTVFPEKPKGRCVVIGAGKGSAQMAAALEDYWPDVMFSGVIATRYGHGTPTRHIRIIEAGHPYPDKNSIKAGEAVMAAVTDLRTTDTVIALISGGGSACLAAPVQGMSLTEMNRLTRDLLACGATISEINTVRKCLSRIKGGRLAAICAPAKLINLVISDIPGDNVADVASGPTIPQTLYPEKAQALLTKYGIDFDPAWFAGQALETTHDRMETRLIASPFQALRAMEDKAAGLGYETANFGDLIETDSRIFAREMADMVLERQSSGKSRPLAIISGGETSVTLKTGKPGLGGRNTEFMLALLTALQGNTGYAAIAIDSDGFDGSADAAGAMITPEIVTRATKSSLNPQDFLARHDSYSFFEHLDAAVKTGPTYTNVNDLRVVIIA